MAGKPLDFTKLNNRVVKSGQEFEAVIKEMVKTTEASVDQACRGAMFGLYTELVERCPKDTARAAAGFNISEQPNEWTPPPGDYDGNGAGQHPVAQILENHQKLNNIRPLGTISISNNVEYLLPLENGHSVQAPSGFIALSIDRFGKKLQAAIDEESKRR